MKRKMGRKTGRKGSLTDDQRLAITLLWLKGVNQLQISKRLKISYWAVRRCLLKHGYVSANYQIIPDDKREKKAPPSDIMIRIFESMRADGESYASITRKTGYSYQTIRYYTDPEYAERCKTLNKDLYNRYRDRWLEYSKRAYEKRKAICQEAKEAAQKNQVVE